MTTRAQLPEPDVATAVREDLEALYRSWRILDLVGETADELPREWLAILNIARNLMDSKPLPGVDMPVDLQRLVTPAQPLFTVTRRTEHKRRVVYPVTGDTEVQPLRNLTDFPQITLPDLMLRDVSPELFEYRLLSSNINGLYNIDPGPAAEEWDEVVEERVPTGGMSRHRRQRVYVLFDVSNSMRDANKILFAKALVLAYLITASEERAKLYFRTFANSVHARTDSTQPGALGALAQRVLSIAPDGSTDIQAALAAAIGDINALDGVGHGGRKPFEQSPTELLLISDCESYYVPHIPRGIRMHTVHLKGGPMMKGYQQGFEQIRAASATFHEIDTTKLVLPVTARDRWLLMQDGRQFTTLPSEAHGADAQKADRNVRRKMLLAMYERMDGPQKNDPGGGVRNQRGERGSIQRIPLGAALQMLWTRLRKLFHLGRPHRAHRPAHSAASLGLQFRQRR